MKKYISFLILFLIVQIEALVKLSNIEDNNIVTTGTRIRDTVNKLFSFLKIQAISHKPRLSFFFTIHEFFTSITLRDAENLNEIVRLSRVVNIDNNTRHFIAQINEVLNEGDKNDEDNVYVTKHIETFINKLKDLKETYASNKAKGIKESFLKYFKSLTKPNVTKDINGANETNKDLGDEDVLSDNEYWKPSGRRIANGIRTKIKQFPFIASVHFFKQFHCAGSIIKSDLVITSASCLQIAWNNRFFRENPRFLSVQVGSDFYQGSGENIDVLEIYFHPQYNAKNLNNNLAVMRLYKQINFKYHKYIKKIDFDRGPWPLPVNSAPITVIGWGAKDHNNIVYDVFRNRLSYAELDFYSLHNCQEHYTKQYVTDKHFCAGSYSKGDGACNRDAGGPGIIDDKLVGVVSFGSPVCGAQDAPTVFTKLGFYADWIDQIMEQVVPSAKARTTTKAPKTFYSLLPPYVTSHFSVTPVRLAPLEPISAKVQPIPIHDVDSLRIAQDKGFKDFMLTLFEDDEINELLENSDLDSPEIKEDEHSEMPTIKQDNLLLKTETTSKTVPMTTESAQNYSSEEDDNIILLDKKYFDMGSESTLKTVPTVTELKPINYSEEDYNTTLVEKMKNDIETESNIKPPILEAVSSHERTLEEDIKALVDNLDLEQLFKPAHYSDLNKAQILLGISENVAKHGLVRETPAKLFKLPKYSLDSNRGSDDKIVKATRQPLAKEPYFVTQTFAKVPLEKLFKPSTHSSDSSKGADGNVKHIAKQAFANPIPNDAWPHNNWQKESSMVMALVSHEDNNNENGLSIAEDSFQDLTFRDKAIIPQNGEALSEPQLVDWIALAVEAEARRIRDERHAS